MDCFMEIMVRKMNNTTPFGTTLSVSDPETCGVNTTRVRARNIPGASKIKQKNERKYRFGSWNVGSMNQKSYQLEEVMIRRKIDILCVQETKWKNMGNKSRFLNTTTKQFKIHYHGIENHRNGVGVILSRDLQESVVNIEKISDRLMNVKIILNEQLWNIVSAYAPQIGCTDIEKEKFWMDLENLLKRLPANEIIFIGADLNGHVGTSNNGDKRWHGGYAHGTRNDQGNNIMLLAKSHDLVILNTIFRKQERHLITYSSGGRESQIDYHLCNRAIKKYVKDCKVILGEDVVEQHRLLLTEFRFEIKNKTKETSVKLPKIKWHNIGSPMGIKLVEQMQILIQNILTAEDEMNADEVWQVFQDDCIEKAKHLLGVSKGRLNIKKESWFWKSEEVKEAVKNKKKAFQAWSKCTSNNTEEKETLRELKETTKKYAAKTVAITKAMECQKLYDDLESPEGSNMIYKIAAQRRNNAKPIQSPKYIENEEGQLLTDDKDIIQGWTKYYSKLLNEEFPRTEIPSCEPVLSRSDDGDISEREIEEAVKQMKRGRATGPDEIPSELWKTLGPIGTKFLHCLFNKIKNGDPMPRSFRESFLLPFYKGKGDSRKCGNYRAVKLMSHTMKIWERIISNRISPIILPKIHANQCGFVPEKSTSDAIQAMRILIEKFRDAVEDLHIIFIDLEKAFDRVPRDLIWSALRNHGVPEKYVKLIKDMYHEATTKIKCPAGISNSFPVKVGVHQGSVMSPLLFNTVINYLTCDITDELLLSVLFADDVGLANNDITKLQEIFNRWKSKLENNGLKISESKTEYLFLPFSDKDAPVPDIMINNNIMPKCKSFKHLGSVLSENGSCNADVNHRISVAWLKWQQNSPIFCDKKIPRKLKGRLHQTIVRPALTYGAKCWTMYRKYEQDLNTAEMKMIRMSMGVTKFDHIKSIRIRKSMYIEDSIAEKLQKDRVNWFEKIHKAQNSNVVKKVMALNVPKAKKKGRPKHTWISQMEDYQKKYGLTTSERQDLLDSRRTLRTRSTNTTNI